MVTQLGLELRDPCRLPKEGSQCRKLLDAMKLGVRLTIWNAMAEYQVGALHQRCNDLKDMGWPVLRQEVTKNGKRVAEFWMEAA